ncbi:Htc1p ASCRUDRAFT_126905 [Ascoidea rubescens DSM 1968]|uniref:Uncharacterized protein n=1 Tax=Ascoidea rubescens DSM 1968 TaxID=1344418 RepID=A0A1D2VN74_9ASCO|nr:hypothetical protein ASCRUDRAFT_126905 [Ascoidea rubescens DSM 1968]ODV63071.1 hypothetical protein ASCRUDRAFT_126905 [Ascoidea rubescens DSM 1968]
MTVNSVDPISWSALREIVHHNRLAQLKRAPEVTAEYHKYKHHIAVLNTSVFKHLVCVQLKWASEAFYLDPAYNDTNINLPLVSNKSTSHKLFMFSEDTLILPNHFPYNLEQNIKHLVVWSKILIKSIEEENEENDKPIEKNQTPINDNTTQFQIPGDISLRNKSIIHKYIVKTFHKKHHIKEENILWFRNFNHLQSIKTLSHIHVLVKDVPSHTLDAILETEGALLTEQDYLDIDKQLHNL